MKKTFEDFLKEKHDAQYTGVDDDMPDAYDEWFYNEISKEDIVKYADEYVNQLTQELIKDCKKIGDILAQPLTK